MASELDDWVDECEEYEHVGSPMYCNLNLGHPGDWHYDAQENITWRKGKHVAADGDAPATEAS